MPSDAQATAPDYALAALLDWYAAVGVDIAVDALPHDRFAESARPSPTDSPETEAASVVAERGSAIVARPSEPALPPRSSPAPAQQRRSSVIPAFPHDAARAAQEGASAASSLADLRTRLEAFDGCALKTTASHFVFGAGAPGARLMVLDFSPGEEEERSGEVFVGASGRLLDKMLASIGLDRTSAYLAHYTPWRPPGGRELNKLEAATLLPFTRRHVELASPDILLLLGEPTAKTMLGANDVVRLREAWFNCPCGAAGVQATLSPGLESLLKTPVLKRRAWRALRAVASALSGS